MPTTHAAAPLVPSPSNARGMASAHASERAGDGPPVRRVRKGMRAADLAPGGGGDARLVTGVAAIDSPFQLQEYLALLLADAAARGTPSHDDVERIVRLPSAGGLGDADAGPGTAHGADNGHPPAPAAPTPALHAGPAAAEEPHSVEIDVWIYEHLRRIVQDLGSTLVPALQAVCRPPLYGGEAGCAAMNAGAWMFLCAAHGDGERQCPAIDYTQHTLDAITSTLVAPRLFPSRTYVPATSLRHFASISRRISRIFLHAREHHRDVFDATEVRPWHPLPFPFPPPLCTLAPSRTRADTVLVHRPKRSCTTGFTRCASGTS